MSTLPSGTVVVANRRRLLAALLIRVLIAIIAIEAGRYIADQLILTMPDHQKAIDNVLALLLGLFVVFLMIPVFRKKDGK